MGTPIKDLATSWKLSLRSRRRSPKTIASYLESLEQFNAFSIANELPTDVSQITRRHVEAFITDVGDRCAPATAAVRYRSLQQFWRWAVSEDEVDDSPMRKMVAPFVPEQPVPVLTTAQFSRLLATCTSKSFVDRRDTATIRLFADTGMRRSELGGLLVDDIDLDTLTASVVGKGARPRSVPFSPATATAIVRYLREREQHPPIDGPDGDPWILLEWRGSPVCNHGTNPLVALDRQQVDEILAKAASTGKVLPYIVDPTSGREALTYPEWPPSEVATPTGRLRVAVIPHDGQRRQFSYEYTPPDREFVAAQGEIEEVAVDDLGGLVIHLSDTGKSSDWSGFLPGNPQLRTSLSIEGISRSKELVRISEYLSAPTLRSSWTVGSEAGMADVQSIVREYVVDELLQGDTSEEFDGATDLIEEGFLDSLGIMSMVGFLEERFAVEIDAEEVTIENFETMDAICGLLAGKLSNG